MLISAKKRESLFVKYVVAANNATNDFPTRFAIVAVINITEPRTKGTTVGTLFAVFIETASRPDIDAISVLTTNPVSPKTISATCVTIWTLINKRANVNADLSARGDLKINWESTLTPVSRELNKLNPKPTIAIKIILRIVAVKRL